MSNSAPPIQLRSTAEVIAEMQRAALQTAIAFERIGKLPRREQAEALRQVSATLIEMRRTTDGLALRLR